MLRNRPLRFALITAAALLAVPAVPAGATPRTAPPAAALVLTGNPGEAVTPAAKWVLLTCGPNGGTHPAPGASCSALAATGGSISTLRLDRDAICPMIYDPVTVSATGVWQGRRIREQITFPNRCVLIAETGPVFGF
ncbi:subtilase-type protease inhibitor [Allokutzneria sp. A3M-2-11 16]|uniref:SSI family serine proteinase inhibitor n=1 Tax=Allokutzneria sp. A3M-2-11 16 TaxID=2962043 RepID=UPI0020B6FBB2|nr:SSI family serine proteinase inhibitor [Allokutzneria sp. A3M-2-11 16]MCP3800981.1 subtilase-type protease inhibitor [Allokutzneria sp. A3M-2-11 16]